MKTISPGMGLAKLARGMHSAIRCVFYAVQPWYDWGKMSAFRLDAVTEAEMTEGLVCYLEVQWFGVHFGFTLGRTPAKSVMGGAP